MKKGEMRGKKGQISTLNYQFYRVLRGEKANAANEQGYRTFRTSVLVVCDAATADAACSQTATSHEGSDKQVVAGNLVFLSQGCGTMFG
jgi:hypothetical protein